MTHTSEAGVFVFVPARERHTRAKRVCVCVFDLYFYTFASLVCIYVLEMSSTEWIERQKATMSLRRRPVVRAESRDSATEWKWIDQPVSRPSSAPAIRPVHATRNSAATAARNNTASIHGTRNNAVSANATRINTASSHATRNNAANTSSTHAPSNNTANTSSTHAPRNNTANTSSTQATRTNTANSDNTPNFGDTRGATVRAVSARLAGVPPVRVPTVRLHADPSVPTGRAKAAPTVRVSSLITPRDTVRTVRPVSTVAPLTRVGVSARPGAPVTRVGVSARISTRVPLVRGRRAVTPPSPSSPNTRQMIDRDTLRLQSRDVFIEAIRLWKAGEGVSVQCGPRDVCTQILPCVYVRKRPIFEHEISNRDFDIISVFGNEFLITHNCLFYPDLRRMYITHSIFDKFTKCFSSEVDNEEVFQQCGGNLICEQMIQDEMATIFMFGQTGSGKTYTMRSIEEKVAQRVAAHGVYVSFIEVAGKNVFDLIPHERVPVRLRERPDGSILPEGATEVFVSSETELVEILRACHRKRRTESTDVNDTSSRSHAICSIRTENAKGKLMLVDLAGTERRKDSMWHDRDRQKESAEINASLHALKECIRWRTNCVGVAPVRLSPLTRILAESFLNPKCLLSVIATISPCATDFEHTISTLRTVNQLAGSHPIREIKQTQMSAPNLVHRKIPPKNWTPNHLAQWWEHEWGKEHLPPKGTTGQMLVRMSAQRFIQLCNGNEQLGNLIYQTLHKLIAKRAVTNSK